MRSKFALWSDNGRIDYGFERPRLTRTKRLGVAILVLAVAGIGVRSFYSQMIANAENSQLDNLANAAPSPSSAPAIDAAPANAEAPAAAKPRVQPQTVGLAPVGAPDRSKIVEPRPVAVPASTSSVAASSIPPAEHAQAPADVAAIDSAPKPDEKPRIAKKKPARSASVVQVYDLPDGRQVSVRRPARTDGRYAESADFDSWGGLRDVPRASRRVARPGVFEAPF